MEYRLLVYGCSGAGKLAMLEQLVQSHFLQGYYDPSYWPRDELLIGNGWRKQVIIDDEQCLLHLEMANSVCVCAEYPQLPVMPSLHVLARHFHAILVCYSITSRHSYEAIVDQLQSLHAYRSRVSQIDIGKTTKIKKARKGALMGMLSRLPSQVLLIIFQYVTVQNVHRLRQCCKLLRVFVDERGPKKKPPPVNMDCLQWKPITGDTPYLGTPRYLAPVILCALQCDLEESRNVTTTEAEEFAKSHGLVFHETSAKRRINVEEAFYDGVRAGRKAIDTMKSRETQEKDSKQCCIA